jgi:aminoglycoside phosphotransferase (APT) family kinase protein
MGGIPDGDVTIDAEVVQSLLATSPWPAAQKPVFYGRGFDNEVWYSDNRAIRIPRRQEAVNAILIEQRWLNQVVGPLPVKTPAVLFAGKPTDRYPYPWSITHFVEGRTGFECTLGVREAGAAALGGSLRVLHRVAPPDAPRNPLRGVALERRVDDLQARLAAVDTETSAIVMRHFARGLTATSFDDQALWIHGDIHPGNLVYEDGELHGMIDFSDLACGDPAVDLGGALLTLPSAAHESFWASYANEDADLRARSLGWAALLVVLHLQTEIAEHTTLAHEALAWLAQID